MKHVITLSAFLILTFSNAIAQIEEHNGNQPCKAITSEHLRTTFEEVKATQSDEHTLDTIYVFIEYQELANLEKLSSWAVENGFYVRWHKDVEYGGKLSNVIDIGFYKSDVQLEDFTAFVDAIISGQRQLKLKECIDGTLFRIRPIE